MHIEWIECKTYEEARDYSRIIYLHEWDGKPFYWGKAHNSFFGGHKRNKDGLHASGRYNSGYRHWIEGCLRHGAKLYVGILDPEDISHIDEVENFLISTYGHVMNTKVKVPKNKIILEHTGDIPATIHP